jgi:hypothetical protein
MPSGIPQVAEDASGFSRAAHRFDDLRRGWEAVPFQNSDAQSFSAITGKPFPFKSRCFEVFSQAVKSDGLRAQQAFRPIFHIWDFIARAAS